ncbi:MAG: hypothetical protein Q9212_006393 [Teloschistes hypoglaucus]
MASIEAANLFTVNGLVAVITGGGSGIGLMMANALAANGAHKVYIIGRRKEVLEAAAKESPHGNIVPLVGDVTSKDSLHGIAGPQLSSPVTCQTRLKEYQSLMWDMPSEDYTHICRNEVCKFEQKSQFIVTSSIGGFNRSVPGGYAYGQSKAAATHLVKQMATNMVPYGIRANAIAPGLYPSELSAPIIGDGVFPKEKIPAERVGTEEDMAGCILYLTSRAGAYLNGNVIVTDGGRLSMMQIVWARDQIPNEPTRRGDLVLESVSSAITTNESGCECEYRHLKDSPIRSFERSFWRRRCAFKHGDQQPAKLTCRRARHHTLRLDEKPDNPLRQSMACLLALGASEHRRLFCDEGCELRS